MGEPLRRRVTYGQLEQLWEFLNLRKDLATGYNKTSRAREFSRRMWEEIALSLNSHGDGAEKDWKGWCKYWNDYKSKLKKLAAATKASQQKTGGGQSTVKQMTDLELKFLHLLGEDFGTGLPGVRVEPFEEVIQIAHGSNSVGVDSEHRHGSESILTGMDLASMPILYEYQPGPSGIISPSPHFTPRCSPRQHSLAPLPSTPPNLPLPLPSLQTTPRRSPRRRLLPQLPVSTPSQPQPVPLQPQPPAIQPQPAPLQPQPGPIQPQTAPTTHRRRRSRHIPLLTLEEARRAIIDESRRQTQIQEAKLEIFRMFLNEFREFREIFQQR